MIDGSWGETYSVHLLDGNGRLFMTATSTPGTTGGYVAQKFEYDVLGRTIKQSNPTDVNWAWAPSGDDAAGWIQTQQAYDWKGRPTLTTLADGATRENTYGGCGCAGGEVTTVRDERGRRRKLTKDVLGRLKQVDELNWDQSVYATTTYSFNARDQITAISQAGQPRSFTYDGYGRVASKTTPEQGAMSYSYFANDAVQTVTDARGVISTFAYNNRNLVTGISYNVSGDTTAQTPATPSVSFGYDAAGNRTSMTDGLGSASYSYNTLSQLTAETRTFTGVTPTFTLSYDYNTSGELTSITNPFGAQVGYYYDVVGRPISVRGSGYAGDVDYVNSISYRAFGVKAMSYENGKTLSLQYDSRMRATQWSVPGVMRWNYGYDNFNEKTGRVTYAQNLDDATLDRSYDYDQVGRLVSAHTGREARWHINPEGGWPGIDGPYSQDRGYDQLGNATHRVGWGGSQGSGFDYNYSFTNNRLVQDPATSAYLQYDAAGNLKNDGYQTASYDATGQQTYQSGTALTQAYDGDRLRGKKTENGTTTYYLRSSVLGGQVVAEINASGGWTRGYVYLGGQMVAIQGGTAGAVSWVHQDPVTKSQRITDSSGTLTSTVVDLDPWGGETSRSSNVAFQPHEFTSYRRDANGGDEAMHRRYQANWNRFLQPDPSDGSYNFSNPQSLNRYSYAQNDPVNLLDPSGLVGEAVWQMYGVGINRGSGGTAERAQAEADYDQRLSNTLDALAATAAYRRGGPNDPTYRQIRDRNNTLVPIVTFSRGQEHGLALISVLLGDAVADQVRFDAVAKLTGLSDYILDYQYNASDRTFQVSFAIGINDFLAQSPYFAGPGLALLHRDVGTWDYRSYSDLTGGLSMQVVLGNNLNKSYADFDRDNPYQDVASFFRHNIPIIIRRIGRIGG